MLRLRSSVAHHRAEEFGTLLRDLEGVRRIVRQAETETSEESYVFVADVEPAVADRLIDEIHALGLGVEDYVLSKVDVIAPQHRHQHGDFGSDGFAWIEVIGQARANSRPLARYLALINVAAVIAALGVITSSSILIVGAMAVSPDLLPICATAVGIVSRRYGLAQRAFTTLVLGLGLVVVTAMVLSALLNWAGLLPDGFAVEQSSLSTLAHTDYSTVLIALAAGVAAMLSFETRASAAVGVAISVTTIPASAYLGVALGGGGIEHALGAAVVLAINVSLLIVSATLTLAVQRWLPNRSGAPI
ncbi:MAG TPA: DUF389 domain-containing protein [Solirubrobacterales bacterium]|jgi:uncharacterized hydrophobic protein (TIGR00271 family)|nr:DUF389 domain-containing protein [Solirubrobacterales bacterium]